MVQLSTFTSLLIPLSMASTATAAAMFNPRQQSANSTTASTRKLIVGAPGQILAYDYDGTTFANTANSSSAGTAPSWMLFKEPNLLYAVDENSNTTRLYEYSPLNNSLSSEPVSVGEGSAGVVSLAFNKDQTILIGASYSDGQVDVWDISSPDGSLKLVKQIPLEGTLGPAPQQTVHRAHQAVLDPTGQFFAVADLGGDAIHIINASSWEISNVVYVDSGAGPRHGAYIGGNSSSPATHYAVACEIKNLIILWEVDMTGGNLNLTNPQTLSTFGDAFQPQNATTAAAGELIAASNSKDIYVTNRLTGNGNFTDNISHFVVEDGKLSFADQISTDGINPRQLSFSLDESIVFGVNQGGSTGLFAFNRCSKQGTLSLTASLSNTAEAVTALTGPQFVQEIPVS
ncbi:hypothetical protein PFICI_12697 [Pestalotiopsis fici W106-1]|uniref:6-phosphogluconolactonase n=1 Tax=Pestalotiopsis fici (strain W106-1 / CGMCC3.15140) TaxID=1229662 RepID=W3WPH8_PESFW|nr:uncharacterized protein PFICI_12697 [Pestalotiopsis fici W106-1]ETS75753.1 hypothetical protein PFICI_12697 [Pestalotiopsis fici W106-1]